MAKAQRSWDIDMDALKEDWEKENSRKGQWRPDVGEHLIRVLPRAVKAKYYKEFKIHYDPVLVAGGTIPNKRFALCFDTYGQECPICRRVEQAYAMARVGEREDADMIKRASKARAKKRFVMGVVDMEQPKLGCLTWEIGIDAFKLMQPLWLRWGNLAHPETGQVLAVTVSKKERYNVVSSIQPTNDKTVIPVANWEDSLPDLDAYVTKLEVPIEEVRSWCKGDFLSRMAVEEEVEPVPPPGRVEPAAEEPFSMEELLKAGSDDPGLDDELRALLAKRSKARKN